MRKKNKLLPVNVSPNVNKRLCFPRSILRKLLFTFIFMIKDVFDVINLHEELKIFVL